MTSPGQSDTILASKPWRLDFNSITPGDGTAIRNWSTQLINYIRQSDKKSCFDFAKSRFSWEASEDAVSAYQRFKHPASVQELKDSTDTDRYPFIIVVENDQHLPGRDMKVEAENANQTFAQTSYMAKRIGAEKITNTNEAYDALVTTAAGYTNCRAIAIACLKFYKVNISNPHELYQAFISDFEKHLRVSATLADLYLPRPYESALASGAWRDFDQMVAMFYKDVGVEINKEKGPLKPVDFLTAWEMFGSHNYGSSRTQMQMRVIQQMLKQLRFNYNENSVNVDEFIEDRHFESEDVIGPIASFVAFSSSTNDIEYPIKKSILADLATNLKKAPMKLTMVDFFENRKWVYDEIDKQRAKKTEGPLKVFDINTMRREKQNANEKKNTNSNFNRARFDQRSDQCKSSRPKSLPIKKEPKVDTFAHANPHRDLPQYSDHKINSDRRGNNGGQRANSRWRSNQSSNKNSRDTNSRENNARDNNSRDGKSSSRQKSEPRKGNNKRSRDSRDFRHVNSSNDDANTNTEDHNNSGDDPENRSDQDNESSHEGKVDSGHVWNNFQKFNRMTTSILRRVNLHSLNYLRVKAENEVIKTSSPCLPIDNILSLNNYYNKLEGARPVIIVDSGADQSLISAELLFSLEKERYTRSARNPFKSSKSASGNCLDTLPFLYDVELLSGSTRLKLKDVVVARNLPAGVNNQVLLGWSDISRKNINFKFSEDEITGVQTYEVLMGKNKTRIYGPQSIASADITSPGVRSVLWTSDKEVNQASAERDDEIKANFKCLNLSTEPDKSDAIQNWLQSSFLHRAKSKAPSYPLREKTPSMDLWSTKACTPSKFGLESSDPSVIKIKTAEAIKKYPNKSVEIETMHKLEKKLVQQRSKNTIDDVKIDPDGNVLPPGQEGEKMRAQIRSILEKHKVVFSCDTGDAGDSFMTDVEMNDSGGCLTLNTARNMVNQIPEAQKELICQKLDAELASGTLVRAMGRPIKNFLPIFMVPKKGATADEIIVDASKNRMISNCKTVVNKLTKHVASSTDDAELSVNSTAKFTKHGWSFSCDISDAFHCIRLPRHLMQWFGVYHPRLGPCMYTRLVQGWISSPQICRDFFTHVLSNIPDITRYVDDILGGGESFESLLHTLDNLLGTLAHYNLRLKGSKMTILTKKIEFLGRELVNGKVVPSRHHVTKLQNIKWEDMKTGKELRPYLGLYNYCAGHVWKSSETLHLLHKAAATNSKEIPWTANNGALIKAFEKSKELLNHTIPLAPLKKDQDLFLVADTSAVATGALLLQKNLSDGPNKYNVIGVFSRKRCDIENKTPTPSCVSELAGISAAVAHFRNKIAELDEDKMVRILTDSQSAVACYKKYLRDNHPSTSMRISSFIATMFDLKYELRFLPNISEEIAIADWFSRTAAASKACTTSCKICNTAQTVTGHSHRVLNARFNDVNFERTFVPPSDSIWTDFQNMSETEKEKFMSDNTSDNDFHRVNAVHVGGTGDEIRDSLMRNNVRVVRRKDIYPYSGTLSELLKSQKVLNEWQKLDKTIRLTKECLSKNLDIPTREPRVRTLIDKYKVFLDKKGVLMTNEDDGLDTKSRVVLPVCVTRDVVDTVHDNLNHGSVNGLITAISKMFHFCGKEYFGTSSPPSLMSSVKGKVRACPGCARLAPNKLSKEPFKVVKIPDTIGANLIVDEFTRLNRKKETWHFVMVTDQLSRFTRIYDYVGHMTTKKFKDILLKIKHDFMFESSGQGESCSIEILCDSLSVHASAMANTGLVKGINIKCKESMSNSKNTLPELDGRLQKISRIMRAELADPDATRADVAYKTAVKYNSSYGAEGFTPLELWRKKQFDRSPFKVNVQALREAIARSRRLSREARERRTGPSIDRQFVPYKSGETDYNNKVVVPLKLGDIIVPYGHFEKNDHNPLYKVVEHPLAKSGCDFDNSIVFTRKIGVQERTNNIHSFHFSAIDRVINGESEESKLFLSENNLGLRWLMFSDADPLSLKPPYTSTMECFDYHTGTVADDAYYAYTNNDLFRSNDLIETESDSEEESSDGSVFEQVDISDSIDNSITDSNRSSDEFDMCPEFPETPQPKPRALSRLSIDGFGYNGDVNIIKSPSGRVTRASAKRA